MEQQPERDFVTLQNEQGQLKQFAIEALFDMEERSYALLASEDETILMRVVEDEEEQYLEGITDQTERDAILSAYQIAVEEAPAE